MFTQTQICILCIPEVIQNDGPLNYRKLPQTTPKSQQTTSKTIPQRI